MEPAPNIPEEYPRCSNVTTLVKGIELERPHHASGLCVALLAKHTSSFLFERAPLVLPPIGNAAAELVCQ